MSVSVSPIVGRSSADVSAAEVRSSVCFSRWERCCAAPRQEDFPSAGLQRGPGHVLGLVSCSDNELCALVRGGLSQIVTTGTRDRSQRALLVKLVLSFLPFPFSLYSFCRAAECGSNSFARVVSSACHFALVSCEDITETLLEQFREDLVKWNDLH